MYIHIGNKKIVSDRKIIGIFNTESLLMSSENARYHGLIEPEHKSVIIDRNNNAVFSIVSPFTLIKRTTLEETVWRKAE